MRFQPKTTQRLFAGEVPSGFRQMCITCLLIFKPHISLTITTGCQRLLSPSPPPLLLHIKQSKRSWGSICKGLVNKGDGRGFISLLSLIHAVRPAADHKTHKAYKLQTPFTKSCAEQSLLSCTQSCKLVAQGQIRGVQTGKVPATRCPHSQKEGRAERWEGLNSR
jgi:hypothetical protein